MDVVANSTVCMGRVAELLTKLLGSRRTIIITDSNVDRCHHALISSYQHIVIGLGEQAKSFATLEKVYTQLMEMNADRSTFLLGIGGGVVTDITGFVATTYMRGVNFGFIPTTLLAEVDASVGGKNGVNVGGFKNMVGTFSKKKNEKTISGNSVGASVRGGFGGPPQPGPFRTFAPMLPGLLCYRYNLTKFFRFLI